MRRDRIQRLSARCSGSTHHTANMVEKFVGTWKMISSENFDDYMKAIGTKEKERERDGWMDEYFSFLSLRQQ